MNFLFRAVLTLGLLAAFAFFTLGYLGAGEYAEASLRVPWQVGYEIGGIVCLLCIGLLWRSRRRVGPMRPEKPDK